MKDDEVLKELQSIKMLLVLQLIESGREAVSDRMFLGC